jgi:outer membrane lipoprotein-sorting protein
MNRLRRLILAAPLLLVALGGHAYAQTIPLSEISRYLNDLQTATGEFTQINSDGTISTGTIYIKRPGRMRFEYNPPEKSLVVVGGGSIAVFDGRSTSEGAERYPLNQTPLGLILQRNVNLGQARMVTGHTSDGTTTTVQAQDPDHPEYGNIRLVFTANPTELRQWIITDNGGSETTVILGDLTKGGNIRESLFNIQAAEREWQN